MSCMCWFFMAKAREFGTEDAMLVVALLLSKLAVPLFVVESTSEAVVARFPEAAKSFSRVTHDC